LAIMSGGKLPGEIFRSCAHTRERTIAIYDFEKPIETAKDLEIKRI